MESARSSRAHSQKSMTEQGPAPRHR